MMRFLLFILLLSVSFSGISQLNHYRVTLQPGFDYSYQLTTFKNGDPIDYMSNLGKNHVGMQLSANVFISEKFGLNTKFVVSSKLYSNDKSIGQLDEFLNDYYNPEHYVGGENKVQSYTGDLYFLSLGGVYRMVKNKWNYQFGFNIGAMNLNTPSISYYLKEHGSNNYESVYLTTDMEKKWMLFFEPSVLVSYSLRKRLGLFLAGSYLYSPMRVHQREQKINLYTNELSITEYRPKELFQMVSVKLGLSIGIGKIIEKQTAGE